MLEKKKPFDYFRAKGRLFQSDNKFQLIGFLVLSIPVIIIYFWIERTVFRIPIKPQIPLSLIEDCRPQTISVPAVISENLVEIKVEIRGYKNDLCIVEYVKSETLELMNTYTFAYNKEGHLCGYHDFNTTIRKSKFFCNFSSL